MTNCQTYWLAFPSYGGRLTGYLPFANQRLSLQPAVVFRLLETDFDDDEFAFTDVSLRANWVLSRSWILSSGASYGLTDEEQRVFVDISLTFKW